MTMSVLAFRLGFGAVEAHRTCADAFVHALTTKSFDEAARHIGATISWFGEAVAPAPWTVRCMSAFADTDLHSTRIGAFPKAELERLQSADLARVLDGPLEPTHTLTIYDICKGETWVTIGVLTAGNAHGASVARVIDLRRLKDLAMSIAA